jgi:hypothetical protein
MRFSGISHLQRRSSQRFSSFRRSTFVITVTRMNCRISTKPLTAVFIGAMTTRFHFHALAFLVACLAVACKEQGKSEPVSEKAAAGLKQTENAVRKTGDAVKDAAHKATGAAKDVAGKAADTGKEVARKTTDTVKDAAQKTGDAVGNFGNKALDGLKKGVQEAGHVATNVTGSVKAGFETAGEKVKAITK